MLSHPFTYQDETEDDSGQCDCQELTSEDVADGPEESAWHLMCTYVSCSPAFHLVQESRARSPAALTGWWYM